MSTFPWNCSDEVSKQLRDLFKLSFMTGVFPPVLKTAKVVPVLKKIRNWITANAVQSPLSNVEKILDKFMSERLYTFFSNNNIIYNLQFGFR